MRRNPRLEDRVSEDRAPADDIPDATVRDLARVARECGARFSAQTFVNDWGRSVYVRLNLKLNDRWIVVRASDHGVGITRLLTDQIFLYVGLDGLAPADEAVLRDQLKQMAEVPRRWRPIYDDHYRLHLLEVKLSKLEDKRGRIAQAKRAVLREEIRRLRVIIARVRRIRARIERRRWR